MQSSHIRDEIAGFAFLCQGAQKRFYERQLEDLEDITVLPMREVLTDEQIRRIKLYVKPRKKECWMNAYKVSQVIQCDYVEGILGLDGFLNIDHAFNRINGKYFDVTAELALKNDIGASKDTYGKFMVMTHKEIQEYAEEHGSVGEIYKQRIYDEVSA